MGKRLAVVVMIAAGLIAAITCTAAAADLKRQVEELSKNQEIVMTEIERLKQNAPAAGETSRGNWFDRFTLGGYGEIHYNDVMGDSTDYVDIHRFVLYIGYDFADWIQLHSEIEIEHAFIKDGSGGGELKFEQLYADFLLSDKFNFRVGRILTPMGIINRIHEPPTFYGVERPKFNNVIIPTTWSSDGLGIFGNLSEKLKYEVYVVNGLDGSGFSATNGLRGGRELENPSLNEPAVTGRLDYFPEIFPQANLRLGLSYFGGGLENGNSGINSENNAEVAVYAADFQFNYRRLDLRGEFADIDIDDANRISNKIASHIRGYYVEGAWHFMPARFKKGKLLNADAVLFVRYDDYNTQHRMPAGSVKDNSGDRDDITFGLSFYPIEQLVLKFDYQIRDDARTVNPNDSLNLGIGWQF